MSDDAWKPGDRVVVTLPDKLGDYGRKGRDVDIHGTVRAVDARGVTVDLDTPINGIWDCHALHAELRRGR
jgi:hypothetical protein